MHDHAAKPQGEEPDGDIDEEDPAPAIVVGDVTAKRRPDDRGEQRGDAKQSLRGALLFRAETRRGARPGSRVATRRQPGLAARGHAISMSRFVAIPHRRKRE